MLGKGISILIPSHFQSMITFPMALYKSCFIYFLNLFGETEIVCRCAYVSGGGAEREKERIPSRLHAASTEPNMGLKLMKHEIVT